MRDRREALKLLAGGTATALGASIITTSTAFADGGTTTCQPTGAVPGVSLTASRLIDTDFGGPNQVTNAVGVRITSGGAVNIPSMTCSPCSGRPATLIREYLWSIDASPGSALVNDYFPSLTADGVAITGFASGVTSVPAEVWVRRSDLGIFPAAQSPIAIPLRLTVRWVCRNGASAPFGYAWKCASYGVTVTWNANGDSNDSATVGSFSSATIGQFCESPAPSA